jgi:hypothetical protein
MAIWLPTMERLASSRSSIQERIAALHRRDPEQPFSGHQRNGELRLGIGEAGEGNLRR